MKRKLLVLVLLISFFGTKSGIAQLDSTRTKKELKNTIFYNVTNTLLFGGKAQVFCYERVINKQFSATIEGGTFSLPGIRIVNDNIRDNLQEEQTGYKVALDFRYYPQSENKYSAPRGVYVGPYVSYNYFNRDKSFIVDTTTTVATQEITVSTEFTFETITAGLQLGYQFVFFRRLAIDLILIGPGITSYKVNAKLDTSFDPEQESELFQTLNDKLAEKIPGYSYVIEPGEFNKTGTTNTTSIGFRYLVHIGFRF